MQDMIDYRIADRNAEAAGVSLSTLMENAGKRIVETIDGVFAGMKHVVFVCGPGNNGGDGFVAAFLLSRRRDVSVIVAPGSAVKRKPDLEEKLDRISGLVRDASILGTQEMKKALIVDCLLGSGINRPPSGEFLSIVEMINGARKNGSSVLSVDVPSGFPFEERVRPDVTVTFMDVKSGMNESNSGRIITVDVGIPERAMKYTGPGELELYPVPKQYSHKGNNGVVTVVGAGAFTGAAVFSTLAAYRTGADLVYTFVPGDSVRTVASFSPSIMAFPAGENSLSAESIDDMMPWIGRSGAVLVGPGTDASSGDFIRTLIGRITCPLVIDAGGIEVAGRHRDLLRGKDAVITPHAREFTALTGARLQEDTDSRRQDVMKWAAELGVTILLKGAVDIISDGKRVRLNDTGNPGMTVGGTGDVLAGVVAALMSKGLGAFNAARLGAYINGCAGDLCFRRKAYGLMANDVIEAIPDVLVSIGGDET